MEKRQSTVKLTKDGTKYLRMNERLPESIPKGLRLVHNFEPGRPGRGIGEGGFRVWWEKADAQPRPYLCRCGWAPHLKHYDSDAHGRKWNGGKA